MYSIVEIAILSGVQFYSLSTGDGRHVFVWSKDNELSATGFDRLCDAAKNVIAELRLTEVN